MKRPIRFLSLPAIVYFIGFLCPRLEAQVPGQILIAATPAANPLNPNGDNYATASGAPYTTTDYWPATELPFLRIPLVAEEPINDLTSGATCSVTEIVDDPDPARGCAFVYFDDVDGINDNGNDRIFFRIRCAKEWTSGNFGFSVLLDTDGRMGFNGANADPNAVSGNPGFELEVRVKTGGSSGIYIDNVDGNTSGITLSTLAIATNYQESYALFNDPACSYAPVFHDFYVLLTDLGLLSTTPIRFVPATSQNGNTVLAGGAADIGGINDLNYQPDDSAFVRVFSYDPTPPEDFGDGGEGFLPVLIESFSGFYDDNGVNLHWSMTSNASLTGFTIEKARMTGEFSEIAWIPCGEVQGSQEFRYTDQSPFEGENLYRLSVVGVSGNV